MQQFDALIIGFGKAGKTVAAGLAKKGWKVALVEKDEEMYGGTCINIACIPTKALVHDGLHGKPYQEAIERKNAVVEKLRGKNYASLAGLDEVTVFHATARFLSDKEVEIDRDGTKETVKAKHIFINTGAESIIPPIKGDVNAENVYTSTTLMETKELPERLAVVGAGPIGLEFASMYASFGSEVTLISPDDALLPDEDEEIASEVQKEMEAAGISFEFSVKAERIEKRENGSVRLSLSDGGQVTADAVLLATGRKPNTEGLGLENTGVQMDDHGAIKVNANLETAVEGIYALGDVKGGPQFTYISLDDSRIVMDALFKDGKRTRDSRSNVPYSIFIDPPLARVGLTARQAEAQGFTIMEGSFEIVAHPKAHVIDDLRGLFKAVVDKKTGHILGASLFGPSSPELINLIKMAMDLDVTYTFLRDQIYNHPVMTEAFNTLFDIEK